MSRITFHIEGEAEVDAAFDWYWEQNSNAAIGFLNAIAEL
jgi:hypothetical protein